MFSTEAHQNHLTNQFSMNRNFWICFSKSLNILMSYFFCFLSFKGSKIGFLNRFCCLFCVFFENHGTHVFSLCFCRIVTDTLDLLQALAFQFYYKQPTSGVGRSVFLCLFCVSGGFLKFLRFLRFLMFLRFLKVFLRLLKFSWVS